MGTRYLIDTNAIIDFCNGKIPENGRIFLLNITPEISIITHIELFATKNITQSEYELLQKFVSFSKIHSVDKSLVDITINIRQEYKIKLPDAIIAATALANDFTLISRNTKDFQGITDLKYINPYDL